MLLETFQAFWDATYNGVAYITIQTPEGTTLWGEYKADKLTELGCRERRRFIIRTVENEDGTVNVEFEPIPDVVLSPEYERELMDEIDRLFPDE